MTQGGQAANLSPSPLRDRHRRRAARPFTAR
jgi:hypothetical protein